MRKIIKEIRDAIIIVTSLPDVGYVVNRNGKYAVFYDGNDGYTFWDYPLDILEWEDAVAIVDAESHDSNVLSIEKVFDYKKESLSCLNKALACFMLNEYADGE